MIFGHSNYPGLEGFSLSANGDEIVLKTLNGLSYSPQYFFTPENFPAVLSAIETEDFSTLQKLAHSRHNTWFF